MTRDTPAAQKAKRAAADLESCCRQLERLARRVSRIESAGRVEPEEIAPLESMVGRLGFAVAKLKSAVPVVPWLDGSFHELSNGLASSAGASGADASIESLMSYGSAERGLEDVLAGPSAVDGISDGESQSGECVLVGKSPSLAVPTVLELLASLRKSGTLTVNTDGEAFNIDIVDGRIVHAMSDNMPLDERLGNILLQRGMICAEDLQTVLDDAGEGFLGMLLEQEKLVTHEELLEALEIQASLLFRRLFSHSKTEFQFHEGQPEIVGIQIEANVTMLLLEGARTADEFENQPETDWQEWLQ